METILESFKINQSRSLLRKLSVPLAYECLFYAKMRNTLKTSSCDESMLFHVFIGTSSQGLTKSRLKKIKKITCSARWIS